MYRKRRLSNAAQRPERGRPPKQSSIEDFGLLSRGIKLITYFHLARPTMKYDAAREWAARKEYSSASEVKRMLSWLQPRGAREGLITYGGPYRLSQTQQEQHKAMGLPEVFCKDPEVIPIGFGPIPAYPRFNAPPTK